MAIDIHAYTPAMANDAIRVVLPIQRDEFGFDISADDQPDLADIPSLYHRGNGQFWLAYDGVQPVGTVGLHDIDGRNAALRKMFVAASHRGPAFGVARQLMDTLQAHARRAGFRAVYLGTTERFQAAHRFYEKCGFERIGAEALPEGFLRMPADTRFYRLDPCAQSA